MGRRNEHSREQIRQMAIQAASQIIASEGLGGLTARKVAAEIDYTVGSLYMVFRNLDDLVIQVNEQTLDELFHKLKDAVVGHAQSRVALRALGRAYIGFATEHRNRWRAVFEHGLPQGESLPDRFLSKVDRMFGLVQELIRPFAGRRSRKSISLAAQALWSGVHGICILSLTQKLGVAGKASVNEVADELIDNYLTGFSIK
ncbi:MAG: WHG domain-containing protein [Gammaproteobacteria bacterium]|nr:WHG domain-containing protein [Gammaproteobacteria bacterium]